ncbi:hypothetical protein G7077_06890 [Sphingomonas piscis]|uniref:Uncharacterized protein n=1 Tax=Sphingomonas piscis TaxID=2714943 RepID=A0A6G7YPJ9_9SPHN|nr:hypothetical protein [Sphingomonas piscis]QIK78664.1 hypothetical protein G7077_06890 [Sphingomonas piscis]
MIGESEENLLEQATKCRDLANDVVDRFASETLIAWAEELEEKAALLRAQMPRIVHQS